MRTRNHVRPMRHKTLRLPDELSEEITRRARIKGVPDADYTRLLIERGLLPGGRGNGEADSHSAGLVGPV